MYLIGDIGNTEIKIYIFNTSNKAVKKISLRTKLLSDKYLNKKLKFLKSNARLIKKTLFCSVVPLSFKKIKTYLEINYRIKCKELKQINLTNLINIRVNKKQIGSDRLANAISVIDNKFNYIVLDFGTATTFDVINKNKYLGGIISPGVNLSLESLSLKASLIPNINLSKIKKVIGKNTKSAVRAGFYWGYAGLIDNIIKLIIKQTGKSYKIIFTGGLAHLFKDSIKSKIIINKDLTINGVFKAARYLKK
jgi:type III pantothenate kinase